MKIRCFIFPFWEFTVFFISVFVRRQCLILMQIPLHFHNGLLPLFLLYPLASEFCWSFALLWPSSGKGPATKSDEFLEKFQTAFAPPPPHFWKLYCNFFYNGYGCIYANRYEGHKVWNAFFKVCLVWFFSIRLLKKHTLNPKFTLFCINFMLKKPCLKFPKSGT